MQIKKNTRQPETAASLAHRLTAYSRQAKQYQGNPGTVQSLLSNLPDWKKTTLAALIPLAAASAAQAQCNGPVGPLVVSSGALGNPTFVSFDVDGDAVNDLKLRVVSAAYDWFIAPVNPLFYLGATGGNVAAVAYGATVTRGQANANGSLIMCQGGGAGNFCVSSPNTLTKSIPIRKGDATTGQPGWITVQVTNNYPTLTITILERGVESPTNPSNNTAVVGDCTSLAAGPLPVEMTRFQVEPQQKHIVLAWATANELHNSGFEVQRSTDGQRFAKIGWVAGSGTTATGKEYAFTDNEVQPNTLYYYRLRQLDHNGTENFTPVRSAMVKDGSRLTVAQLFPNPVQQGHGLANFQVSASQEGELDIQLFDARGSQIKQLTQPVAAGANTFSVPVSDMAAGVYFVKMQLGKDVTYQRLVVQD